MVLFRRDSVFWKYATYFAGLVSTLLVVSGAIGGYFAYRDALTAQERIQRTKAYLAATEIEIFVGGVEQALQAAVGKFNSTQVVDTQDLRLELVALLRHHPEISELHWIDSDGKDRLTVSRLTGTAVDTRRDWAADPRFVGARQSSTYVGNVYFHKETEPHVSIATARDPNGSALEAEVNLKYMWDVVTQPRFMEEGLTYVVDRGGQLISHPDIGLVLRRTDVSALPHVRRALDGASRPISTLDRARDINGQAVVSIAAPVTGLGWTVFAEQPIDQALQSVYASMTRSAALVLFGITAAVVASIFLARRMVRPLREIEAGARHLGEGEFARRIVLQTGDELQALAEQFNRMAERLQNAYATQEARIAERTHDLKLANEAKTRFIAAASHDLRQPIHALALFVGQLRESKSRRDDETALIQEIERSAEALRDLLEALLDLSKLDVGAITADPKPFALQGMLSRLAADFGRLAEEKGLAFTVVPTSLWAHSDVLLLRRILQNVIANALRYTAHGRILVGCRRRGREIEVIVADTGIGIEPADLPRVFQEFYRGGSAQHAADKGLGLGLAIVRRLSDLLGHRVTISSTPRHGTVVRIFVERAEPEEEIDAPLASLSNSLTGVRVLVVDDEASARDAMEGILTRWGCEVSTARGVNEAVDRAREERPDVVLCDLSLGDSGTGIDVVARLREECGPTLACAFVTGESAPERIAAARAAGCPIVFKPTTAAKLRALVEYLVDWHESSAELDGH